MRNGHRFRSSQGRRKPKRNRKSIHRGHIVRHNHRRYAGIRGGHRNGKRATLRKARARRLTHRKHTAAKRRKLTRHMHRKALRRHALAHRHRAIHRRRGLTHRRRVLHARHRRHLTNRHLHRRKGLHHPHKGWHGHHKIHHPRKPHHTPQQFQGFELGGTYTSMFGD